MQNRPEQINPRTLVLATDSETLRMARDLKSGAAQLSQVREIDGTKLTKEQSRSWFVAALERAQAAIDSAPTRLTIDTFIKVKSSGLTLSQNNVAGLIGRPNYK